MEEPSWQFHIGWRGFEGRVGGMTRSIIKQSSFLRGEIVLRVLHAPSAWLKHPRTISSIIGLHNILPGRVRYSCCWWLESYLMMLHHLCQQAFYASMTLAVVRTIRAPFSSRSHTLVFCFHLTRVSDRTCINIFSGRLTFGTSNALINKRSYRKHANS